MDQAEPPKLEDNNSPEQNPAEGSGIGWLIFALIVAFIYVAYDRGWKITFGPGEAQYCRDVRQKVNELCVGAEHDVCKQWQAELSKCRGDRY